MKKGVPVALEAAIEGARTLLRAAKNPVALVSNWGSNEELDAFRRALGERCASFVKEDWKPQAGEPLEDDFLIRADKNPNTTAALALFPTIDAGALGDHVDLVLVWGEGFDFAGVPPHARTILLGSYVAEESEKADVFIPISIQTERAGHYTNFRGVVSAFGPCFPKKDSVAHAEALFAALAGA